MSVALGLSAALSGSDFSCAQSLDAKAIKDNEFRKNAVLIESMKKLGDDCRTPRDVSFYFYGDTVPINMLRRALGTSANVRPTAKNDGLILEEVMPCEIQIITDRTSTFAAYAVLLKIEFDGWEARVVSTK